MTSSYLFLTPPDEMRVTPENTRTVRDGFVLLGFFFPWIWLAIHRLWLYAVAAFLLQGIGAALIEKPGLWPAGAAIILGVSALVGLEGRNLYIRKLTAEGWSENGLVTAGSLDAAEEVYFSTLPEPVKEGDGPMLEWDQKSHPQARHGQATSLGLFGFDGGR